MFACSDSSDLSETKKAPEIFIYANFRAASWGQTLQKKMCGTDAARADAAGTRRIGQQLTLCTMCPVLQNLPDGKMLTESGIFYARLSFGLGMIG